MQQYLLDSNVFIQAHRMYYPFDVFPGFWKKLEELAKKEIVLSIDKVYKEIINPQDPDQLARWCLENLAANFFVDTTSCIEVYGDIANWAVSSNHRFTQNAIAEFLRTDLADPWLVAYARKNNCILVTQEISEPQRRNKVKIPDVCLGFEVPYVTTIEMLRELRESF